MKSFITHILNKNPLLLSAAERVNNIFKIVKYKIRGSSIDEKYWANRHLQKGDEWANDENGNWIDGYWNSVTHPHRELLVQSISKFNPGSILEIGCNCGPNLYLLAKKYPDAKITGIDINPKAVEQGNELFKKEGLKNVTLIACKADEISRFADNNFDVVFTDAVLIYFGTDIIKNTIADIFRISKKGIVLFEWYDFFHTDNYLGKLHKHWIRNYCALFKKFIAEEKIKVEKIPENLWSDKYWQKYGAIVEVCK